MENFKKAIVQLANLNPSLIPNDAVNDRTKLIEQRFSQFFSNPHKPNHPPYAAMIYEAIRELNKRKGCREKSISKYIKRKYADLPFAHATLLQHHLEELCERKEIHKTHKQRYLLGVADSESVERKDRGGAEAESSHRRKDKKKKEKEKLGMDMDDFLERKWPMETEESRVDDHGKRGFESVNPKPPKLIIRLPAAPCSQQEKLKDKQAS